MAFLAEEIEALDQEIERRIDGAELDQPYQLLQTIPGIRTPGRQHPIRTAAQRRTLPPFAA
jgi:hypothetical protein